MKKFTFKGGIHPKENKELSSGSEIQSVKPASGTYTVPVTMGGAPNTPLVKEGDSVARGQKISDGDKFMNCPVHSPVSGKIGGICALLTGGNSGNQYQKPEIYDKNN